MLDLLSFLEVSSASCICENLTPVLTAVGYVIWGVKVLVPIALIVIGMVRLAQAVMRSDEKDIKTAQGALIKKLIVSIVVFLVPTIVLTIMSIVGDKTYDECWTTIDNPGSLSNIFHWTPSRTCE